MNSRALQHLTRIFWIALSIQVVFDLVFFILAQSSKSDVLLLPVFWDLCTLPLLILIFLSLGFSKREQERQAELERMDPGKREQLKASNLFGQDYEDVLIERRKNFLGKILSPVLIVLSLISLMVLVAACSRGFFKLEATHLMAPVQGSLFLFRACALYILSRYILGVSLPLQNGSLASMGGLGLYQGLICIVLGAVCFIDGMLPEVAKAFLVIGQGIVALYVIEVFIHAILKGYSVEKSRWPVHCSFLAILGFRENLIEQTRQSFEYQFGYDFRSSLKEIFRGAGFPLLLLFLLSLILSSCLVLVKPGHVGFEERFGRRLDARLEAGVHFKLPWPFSRVRQVNHSKIHQLAFGSSNGDQQWIWMDEMHGVDEQLYLTYDPSAAKGLPMNAYAANAVLYYKVSSPRDYLYEHHQPRAVIAMEAHRILTSGMLNAGLNGEVLSSRDELIRSMKEKIMQRFDELKLGVRCTYFSIPQIHPPQKTFKAFEASAMARFEKETNRLNAEAMAEALEKNKQGEMQTRLIEARARAQTQLASAENYLTYFNLVRPVHEKAEKIFLQRKQLETLDRSLQKMEKVIILNPNLKEIDTLNLEQPLEMEEALILEAEEGLK